MPTIGRNNKVIYSEADKQFVKDNYLHMTNQQLAKALGVNLTNLRNLLYSLGLKRMDLEYWTAEMVELLKENYQHQGDTEIAELFTSLFPKAKGWNKRHIEKKRRDLGLKRTDEQKKAIHFRNVQLGKFALCPVKAWETRGGATPEGTILIWQINKRPVAMIKVNGKYVHAGRHVWERNNGPVPPNHIVTFIDQDATNFDIHNLDLVPKSESYRYIHNSDYWIASKIDGKKNREAFLKNKSLLELKRKQLLLNRTIKQQKNDKN